MFVRKEIFSHHVLLLADNRQLFILIDTKMIQIKHIAWPQHIDGCLFPSFNLWQENLTIFLFPLYNWKCILPFKALTSSADIVNNQLCSERKRNRRLICRKGKKSPPPKASKLVDFLTYPKKHPHLEPLP